MTFDDFLTYLGCSIPFIAGFLIWRVWADGASETSQTLTSEQQKLQAENLRLKNELSASKQNVGSPAKPRSTAVPASTAAPASGPALDLSSVPDFPKIEPITLAPLNAAGWAHLKSSVKGYNKSELQDAHAVAFIGSSALLVVCDGAGSKKHSKAGADHCSAALRDEFEKLMKSGSKIDAKNWKDISRSIFLNVATSLEKLAKSQSLQLPEFGCTGIVVLATDDFVGCAHVGDGRAGYLDEKSCWKSILTPYKGAEANATVFMSMLSADNADQYLRTTSHQLRTRSIVALSDGPEGVCWHMSTKDQTGTKIEDPNVPSANFFAKIANQLVAATQNKVPQSNLDKLWDDFLSSGNEQLAKEIDDKTLLIAVR